MKLPVFSAFGASVSYVAAHFLTLLRITWAPALVLIGLMTYLMPGISESQLNMIAVEEAGGSQAEVFAAMGQSMKANGIILLASMIFYPMMIAGVLKHVVRGEAPRMPFYLWYGLDELLVLATYIILIVMFILAGVAGALGLTVIGVISGMAGQAVGGIVLGVAIIAVAAAFIWFMLRMSVAFASSVDKRTIGVVRSWEVTAGAAWSLFFYWLLWVIVFGVIVTVYGLIAGGEMLAMIPEMIATGGDEAALAEIEQRMAEMQADLYDISKPGYWVYAGATYVYTILSVSFWTAAGGVAYRYLTGGERG